MAFNSQKTHGDRTRPPFRMFVADIFAQQLSCVQCREPGSLLTGEGEEALSDFVGFRTEVQQLRH